jgi:hypothetical protein
MAKRSGIWQIAMFWGDSNLVRNEAQNGEEVRSPTPNPELNGFGVADAFPHLVFGHRVR